MGRSHFLAEKRDWINLSLHRRTLHPWEEGLAILKQIAGNTAKGETSVQSHTGWTYRQWSGLWYHTRWSWGTSGRELRTGSYRNLSLSPELRQHCPCHRQNHIHMSAHSYKYDRTHHGKWRATASVATTVLRLPEMILWNCEHKDKTLWLKGFTQTAGLTGSERHFFLKESRS